MTSRAGDPNNTCFREYDPSRLRAHLLSSRRGGPFKCAGVSDADSPGAPRLQLGECVAAAAALEPFEDGGAPSLDLVASTPDCVAWLRRVDAWVRATVVDRCAEWFGKPLSPEQAVDAHQTVLRSEEGEFRIKLRGTRDPRYPTRVFKLDDRMRYARGTYADIEEGARLIPIVQPTVIWFNQKFGLSLRATDILLVPPSFVASADRTTPVTSPPPRPPPQ